MRVFGAAIIAVLLAFAAPIAAWAEPVLLVPVDGAIGPAMADSIISAIEEAEETQAAAVILRIDTPGGLVSSTRDILRAMINAKVPVLAWVAPGGARAASAGTYIVYGSHLAAMAPGTHLGAATPVSMTGPLGGGGQDEGTPSASESKALNDAVATIRSLANLRGRNGEWAEQAVREAATLIAAEAVQRNVVEILAEDLGVLLAKADGRVVMVDGNPVTLDTSSWGVETRKPDWRNRILAIITDPNVAYILMLVGVYGILFELMNPGAIFPGVLGGIALLTGLYALNLLPIDTAGAGLVLLGLALMVGEAFAPSFGILGIGGAIAFAIGSLMMFDTASPAFRLAWPVVLGATLVTLGFFLVALAATIRAHRRKPVSGEPGLLNETATVIDWNGQRGRVHLHGENWQARSEHDFAPGDRARVVGRHDLLLDVEPVSPRPDSP